MTLLIGLDISTTTIGFSHILIENNKIIDISYNYFKPNKKINELKMICEAKNFIIEQIDKICETYKTTPIVCVEDIMLFGGNQSTARTITILTAINRAICVSAFEKYNEQVALLPVATIRSILRKAALLEGRLEKENVPQAMETIIKKHIPEWKFDFEISKKGKTLTENYDKSDGLAVALAYSIQNGLIILDETTKNISKKLSKLAKKAGDIK